jgi:protein-S-isoprenylcysteine O-methyltransferase Ste14
MRRETLLDRSLLVLAPMAAGGALLFFLGGFLGLVDLHLDDGPALAWDAALSFAFFAQHSGMVRRRVQARLARYIPERDVRALYAVASGVILAAVVVLWQGTAWRFFEVTRPMRWAGLGLFAVGVAGFVWGVRSLGHFDPFGIRAIRAHLDGKPLAPEAVVVRGAYRWVRHPLYLFTLLIIWSRADPTADRLLLGVLWTAWIVVGTLWEERDLTLALGDAYTAYQRRVPMLLPFRRR